MSGSNSKFLNRVKPKRENGVTTDYSAPILGAEFIKDVSAALDELEKNAPTEGIRKAAAHTRDFINKYGNMSIKGLVLAYYSPGSRTLKDAAKLIASIYVGILELRSGENHSDREKEVYELALNAIRTSIASAIKAGRENVDKIQSNTTKAFVKLVIGLAAIGSKTFEPEAAEELVKNLIGTLKADGLMPKYYAPGNKDKFVLRDPLLVFYLKANSLLNIEQQVEKFITTEKADGMGQFSDVILRGWGLLKDEGYNSVQPTIDKILANHPEENLEILSDIADVCQYFQAKEILNALAKNDFDVKRIMDADADHDHFAKLFESKLDQKDELILKLYMAANLIMDKDGHEYANEKRDFFMLSFYARMEVQRNDTHVLNFEEPIKMLEKIMSINDIKLKRDLFKLYTYAVQDTFRAYSDCTLRPEDVKNLAALPYRKDFAATEDLKLFEEAISKMLPNVKQDEQLPKPRESLFGFGSHLQAAKNGNHKQQTKNIHIPDSTRDGVYNDNEPKDPGKKKWF